MWKRTKWFALADINERLHNKRKLETNVFKLQSVCVLLFLFCNLMRNTSKSYPHHGARVGGWGVMKLLPRLFAVLLSCKVPDDPDHFFRPEIWHILLFSVFHERPPKRIVQRRVQPIFDSEFTTKQRRLDLWINRNCCSVPQYWIMLYKI